MTIAHAQAMVPGLHIHDAMPAEEEAALHRLALWCTRYSPLVSPDPPSGIFIDIAGSAHLYKGESALLQDLRTRLAASKISARAAVADTPGCAWRSRVFQRRDRGTRQSIGRAGRFAGRGFASGCEDRR
jgi:protein ImuB